MNDMWRHSPFASTVPVWPGMERRRSVYDNSRGTYQIQNMYPGMTERMDDPGYAGYGDCPGYPSHPGYPGYADYADYPDQPQDWPPEVWIPGRDEDLEAEQDLEYFMSLCPYQVRVMQHYVEQVCDHFEHANSMLYDELPDRVAMLRLRNLVLQEAEADGRLFGESGYFDSPDCQAARDMAEILLNHEVAARRRRKRRML